MFNFFWSFVRTCFPAIEHCSRNHYLNDDDDDEWFVFLQAIIEIVLWKWLYFLPFDIESCAKLRLIDFQYCSFFCLRILYRHSNCGFSYSFHSSIHTDQLWFIHSRCFSFFFFMFHEKILIEFLSKINQWCTWPFQLQFVYELWFQLIGALFCKISFTRKSESNFTVRKQ